MINPENCKIHHCGECGRRVKIPVKGFCGASLISVCRTCFKKKMRAMKVKER